jgi:hypothetical protein
LSDYTSENVLQYVTGNRATPTLPSVWLALFTAAPTADAGTGGTECSGNGYARVQVAGALAAGASWTTSSTTLTLGSSAPSWLIALGTNGSGVNVYDATNSQQIGTVSSISGTTVTLTVAASHASSGSTDSLVFSAFPAASASTGTEPAVTPANVANAASVTFPAATGGGSGFGTVIFFGLYDAVTSGNYLGGDYLSPTSGTGLWLPATVTAASPGVITAHAHGYSNGNYVVATAKYGGTIPTFSQSNLTGVLVVVNATTDTFTVTNASTAVNTSSTGDFSVRIIAEQSIPSGVTASFATNTLTLQAA